MGAVSATGLLVPWASSWVPRGDYLRLRHATSDDGGLPHSIIASGTDRSAAAWAKMLDRYKLTKSGRHPADVAAWSDRQRAAAIKGTFDI